jgi:NAD(P)-dependent dehydrogenase (short-subunit alcohol dehydrogenase family)
VSTAIVTGASQGFGKALAVDLARHGWDLVVDARGESDLDEAAKLLRDAGSGQVRSVPGDVADIVHRQELVRAAVDLGDFALLVNNASTLGRTPLPSLIDYPIEDLNQVLAVNVLAPLHLAQLALPYLRKGGGTIVNVTSDAAVEAYEGWGGYGLSKAALEQLSNVLAAEEGAVRVYWFDPGDMRTGMHQDAFPGEDISDRPLPESRVPALLDLLTNDFASGRYTADALLAKKTQT